MDLMDLAMPKTDISNSSKRHISRGIIIGDINTVHFNQEAAILAGRLMRENMQPVESFPFHGLVCFNNADKFNQYSLAQEHGDLINLHNWFQSFKKTISQSGTRTKSKPSTKKRKTSGEPQSIINALIQARFCRAILELQITELECITLRAVALLQQYH